MAATEELTQTPTGTHAPRRRQSEVAGALVVFGLLFVINILVDDKALTSFQLTELVNGSAALALAAIGTTLIVISGGFDLSVGAILSVVNVIVATKLGDTGSWSEPLVMVVAVGAGVIAGAFNGVLIGTFRLPSVIATLATSFIWTGVALLILPTAGAAVRASFAERYTGLISDTVPVAALIIVGALLLWSVFRYTRLGTLMYALGSNRQAAEVGGARIGWATIRIHAAAGFCYGLGGIFLAARTGSGDPGIGAPLVLSVYTAIAVGGTALGGGRGGAVGTVVGAFTVTIISNVLFAIGVSSFYTNVFTGLVLVAAVAFNTLREPKS